MQKIRKHLKRYAIQCVLIQNNIFSQGDRDVDWWKPGPNLKYKSGDLY